MPLPRSTFVSWKCENKLEHIAESMYTFHFQPLNSKLRPGILFDIAWSKNFPLSRSNILMGIKIPTSFRFGWWNNWNSITFTSTEGVHTSTNTRLGFRSSVALWGCIKNSSGIPIQQWQFWHLWLSIRCFQASSNKPTCVLTAYTRISAKTNPKIS